MKAKTNDQMVETWQNARAAYVKAVAEWKSARAALDSANAPLKARLVTARRAKEDARETFEAAKEEARKWHAKTFGNSGPKDESEDY